MSVSDVHVARLFDDFANQHIALTAKAFCFFDVKTCGL